MRIALVAIHPYPSPQAIPLANAFLQTGLTDPRIKTALIDFFIGQDVSECVNTLLTHDCTAIGFSMYVWNRAICREIAGKLRSRLPGIIIFAGGPEATADPKGVLADGQFDFLVIGEGEACFADICARLDAGEPVADIPGVAVREEGGLKFTPAPPVIDLDTIPSPWLNGTLDANNYQGILWQLSRGCAFACDFCYDARGGHGVRRFSLTRVEAELRRFANCGVSQIFVLDSTFNQDAQRAKTILRMIKKIAPHIHFHFEVRSEFIDKEMARLFAEITCSLQIGLQSSDAQVLENVGRNFRQNDFAAKITLLNASGATFGFDLMYGLPGDTLHGFNESINFALGLYPNHLDIFPLAVLPGTALSARSHAAGLNHLPAPPYTLLSSPTFSAVEMQLAGRLANACDIFYTRGKAVAWFNSVVASLNLKPAAFLQLFSEWLSKEKISGATEADFDDNEIWRMQRKFLKSIYAPEKLKRLLPLVLDLADYHHYYSAAGQIPPPAVPDEAEIRKMQIMKMSGRLSPSVRSTSFHYEILDILDAGEPDIRNFTKHFQQAGSWAVIYPSFGGIQTESLIKPYFRLLKSLDGETPFGELAAKLAIQPEEALSFLEFAIADGIISLTSGNNG